MTVLSTPVKSLPASVKTVVLLVNLGTPSQPTIAAVRTYLREFLSDPRVVELPRWLWLGILNLVVLPLRCQKVAEKYRAIWLSSSSVKSADEETQQMGGASLETIEPHFETSTQLGEHTKIKAHGTEQRDSTYMYGEAASTAQRRDWGVQPVVQRSHLQGSPLRAYSQAQAEQLQQRLQQVGQSIEVICAMRYGEPGLSSVLQQLSTRASIEQVLILPLYPQYSATTTASVFDSVAAHLTKWRNQPALRTVKHYYQHPAYISALCRHIQDYWHLHGAPNFSQGDKLLLSFHGIPHRCVELGDPYYHECGVTAEKMRQMLGLREDQVLLSFQSRFGKARWLEPYTVEVLQQLGKAHTKRLDIFCPGFPVDCLETLEEIALEGKDEYIKAGGGHYHFIPCLNLSSAWIDALEKIALENLHGWG